MRKLLLPLCVLFLAGCKTTYYYYPPSPNNTFFANSGEVHLTGDLGVSGVAWLNAKAGVAVTKNLSLIGLYGSGQSKSYHSSEGELAFGYNTDFDKGFIFSVYGGCGLGSNLDQDSGSSIKNFYGSFNKPFIQFTIGTGGAHAEEAFTVKLDYMNYSGHQYVGNGEYSGYSPGTFFYEPYFSGNIGGKNVRFEYGTGFAFRNISEIGKGFRVWPWQFNIGIHIIINRKSDN
jgi:hypothetical protein